MAEKLNVNLHGHVLARFDNWWRKQYKLEDKNLAGILLERCINQSLDVYAITDDVFGNKGGQTRFAQIFEEARILPKPYEIEKIGGNAFVISKDGKQVYFIDGQSLAINESNRKYELLTFGKSGIEDFTSFEEAHKYLSGEGLLSIAEHPLAEGHYGNMKERLIELCSERKIDAVEYNGKIAVPNWLSWMPKFNGFTRKRNQEAVEIAREHRIPVIANDDSGTLAQIGCAYSRFPRNRIKFDDGNVLVESLVGAIKDNDLDLHEGYAGFSDWIKYAVWNVSIKEKALGLREKYLVKNK